MATAASAVDLVSSDDEAPMPPVPKRKGPMFAKPGASKRPVLGDRHVNLLDEDDVEITDAPDEDDVEITDAPPPPPMGGAAAAASAADRDEDLEIVGSKGANALADFPHARENCVTCPFAFEPAKHCANCYCFVCDAPASACTTWARHCRATHSSAQWRAEREAKRNGGAAPPPEPPLARAFAPAAAGGAGGAASRVSALPPLAPYAGPAPAVPEFTVSALVESVVRVLPVEVDPPTARFRTALRHYQRQSLGFCLERERLPVADAQLHGKPCRGGFLCDEMGMGKTAVLIALVVANPCAAPTGRDDDDFVTLGRNLHHPPEPSQIQIVIENGQYVRKPNPKWSAWKPLPLTGRVKLKATVVMTSVSLMGQWEDEVRLHAPQLRVRRFHSSTKGTEKYLALTEEGLRALADVDIIVSTSTFIWPLWVREHAEFHRCVQDESHLFTGSGSANANHANGLHARLRWAVTGTPATQAASQLDKQLRFLGLDGRFLRRERNHVISPTSEVDAYIKKAQGVARAGSHAAKAFHALSHALRGVMVRHTKAQRIGGGAALALPDATTTTVALKMSSDERDLYDRASRMMAENAATQTTLRNLLRNGGKRMALERALGRHMSACANVYNGSEVTKSQAFKRMHESHTDFRGNTTHSLRPEKSTKITALRGAKAAALARASSIHSASATRTLSRTRRRPARAPRSRARDARRRIHRVHQHARGGRARSARRWPRDDRVLGLDGACEARRGDPRVPARARRRERKRRGRRRRRQTTGLRLRHYNARRQRWHHADGGIARLSDGTGARSGRRDAGRRTDPSVSRVRACDARAGF